MKIRKLFAWGFAILIGFLFAFVITQDKIVKIDSVDTDVGICIEDVNFEMPVIELPTVDNIVADNCLNYEEVGIMPGYTHNLVSNTTKKELSIETLQGNNLEQQFYVIENYGPMHIGKLLTNQNFLYERTEKLSQIAKMHNNEREVNGYRPLCKPGITNNKIRIKKV